MPFTPKGKTNNVMDSWPNQGRAFTPGQLGILHKNLSGYDGNIDDVVIRDWCTFHPDESIHIPKGDSVVFTSIKKLTGDVVLDSGSVLTVKCKMSLPIGAKIFIGQKAILLVDGGTIGNACNQHWDGLEIYKSSKVLGLFKHRTRGKIILVHGGSID